jgi:hypothetical protein
MSKGMQSFASGQAEPLMSTGEELKRPRYLELLTNFQRQTCNINRRSRRQETKKKCCCGRAGISSGDVYYMKIPKVCVQIFYCLGKGAHFIKPFHLKLKTPPNFDHKQSEWHCEVKGSQQRKMFRHFWSFIKINYEVKKSQAFKCCSPDIMQLSDHAVIIHLVKRVRFEVSTKVTMKNAVFWNIKTQFVPHMKHITSRLHRPSS